MCRTRMPASRTGGAGATQITELVGISLRGLHFKNHAEESLFSQNIHESCGPENCGGGSVWVSPDRYHAGEEQRE